MKIPSVFLSSSLQETDITAEDRTVSIITGTNFQLSRQKKSGLKYFTIGHENPRSGSGV